MTYWNGSWWDRRYDGSDRVQQGRHGDPDGLPATTCSGRTGCHDLSQSPRSHRDGRLHYPTRTPDAVTDNTYHLRAPFLPAAPVNAWDVQVTFDRFCYTACHESQDVTEMTHERDGSPVPGVVELGTH